VNSTTDVKIVNVDYYAIPDPHDPGRMTYWYRTKRGRIMPHPPKARYGPMLYRKDVPADLDPEAREAWVSDWFVNVSRPWHAAVREALKGDLFEAGLRFAQLRSRCCCCGRSLTDPDSKAYGIGPECRIGVAAEVLARMNETVGRMHATITDGKEKDHDIG
jgi:hypothetical protein